jgi:hypothetical protein
MKETFQEQLARQIGFINRNKPPVMVDVIVQGRVETVSLNGCANIDEYNHYADFMNAAIAAAGGSMSAQESNACTREYNRIFGRAVHMLPETEQKPSDSGDKDHEGNNTTHQPKLEDIHMNATTDTSTSSTANATRIAQLEAELIALTGATPLPADPLEKAVIYLRSVESNMHHTRTDMHHLAAKLTAKKTYTDHGIEVAKVAGGVALGLGLAFGIKAGVEYLFIKPV